MGNTEILQDTVTKASNIPEGRRSLDSRPVPVRKKSPYLAVNTLEESLAAGNIVEITGYNRDNNFYTIQKPTGDTDAKIAVVKTPAAIDELLSLNFNGFFDLLVSETASEESITTAGPIEDSLIASFDSSIDLFNVISDSNEDEENKYKADFIVTGGGSSIVIAKIIARVDDDTYTVDIYGNGKEQDSTEEDATLRILDIASGETIPNDTWLFANKQTWGTEESATSEYTFDAPRWL